MLAEAAFLAPAAPALPPAPTAGPSIIAAAAAAAQAPGAAGSAAGSAAAAAGAAAFALVAAAASSRGGRRGRRVAQGAAEAAAPPPPAFEPAAQLGAGAPLGFFDPLGFAKEGDETGFRRLRASELKHGRVAMMASIGLVGQHFVRLPGFEKAPAGFAAIGTGEGILGFVGLILGLSAFLELAWREQEGREPGNFGDPLNFNMYTEEMRLKEINNGRMAMISVLGIFAAELASGKDAVQQFGL